MISSSTTLLLLLAGISLLLLNDIHGSSSLKIFVNANEILDELDRPGGDRKIDITRFMDDSSDDDSSDDDSGDEGAPPRRRQMDSSDDDSSDNEDSSDDDATDGQQQRHTCLRHNPDGSCQIYSNVQHFKNEFNQLEFKWSSCESDYDDSHDDFETVHSERSLYQNVIFEENLVMRDKCLRLDNTLQQCSSYRPHYHEPFVHLSAAYTNVKRVVFVGGGDSMLLHEVLKYPSLELVLGLELDQKVTRNSFEHFKTQPHFDDERVQWWFGDGAKSLTLLPREYFGTFDLVLLDLSETVMSMTVTEGLDVFGAMKLLLSDTGIMVKNDFGYFEALSKVFDTCIQLVIPDVTYICDYELVLCGTDKVNFLKPNFDHLKGGVETLFYKPLEDEDDHWGPLSDYAKYWGDSSKDCLPPGTDNGKKQEDVAYAGVLMVVEAENVSKEATMSVESLEDTLKDLGYTVLTSSSQPSAKSGGDMLVVVLEEGYVLAETWPDVNYCKIDIHLWGKFNKQESIRSKVLQSLGSKDGEWQSFRIVTGGMRGCHTRAEDIKSIGPDLSKIGVCDEVSKDSNKLVKLNASQDDEQTLAPVIEAGLDDVIPAIVGSAKGKNAVVICGIEGSPCRAKDNLEKKGYANLITLYSCSDEDEAEIKQDAYHHGLALKKWREQLQSDSNEFVMCSKKASVALKEMAQRVRGISVVVVDALAPSVHVYESYQYWLKFWKTIKTPFILFVPIVDAADEQRAFFLRTRYNHGEDDPEFYSEIYAGDGTKTMSFGLIHEGTPKSFRALTEAQAKLEKNEKVKFVELRKTTIRGAAREQGDAYDPVLFSWNDYDQQPGLEQFYDQRAIGVQTVFQLQRKPSAKKSLSASSIESAAKFATNTISKPPMKETFKIVGEGAIYVALMSNAQVTITWDGADSINVNIFTYDQSLDHDAYFVKKFKAPLPSMNLMLKDEMPRGYGKVINKSDRVNRAETPSCYDHYKLCTTISKDGGCDEKKDWMHTNCKFSCGLCEKSVDAKDEL
jgi:S-adenosylmethionine/arginine decarboxylase-like enzyme